ncbi:hypothetical protein C0584_00925 [Candidatus Parcubacteria bacterium]|nr:MAG: hypothetical protein C0584_00925 [Candidatus Parcubacteria bacterium]
MKHHLIFEGAELSGKSWIMSQIYNYLEPKYNEGGKTLDGCLWFNADNGIFGTKYGQKILPSFLEMFKNLRDKNIIVEKFHLADKIYNKLHNDTKLDYSEIDSELLKEGFKIILITFPEDVELLKKRIEDRLNLYPHYKRILQAPEWYIKQQREYLLELKKSKLPHLIVQTEQLPDQKKIDEILNWIGE